MASLRELHSALLEDGKISDSEVAVIRDFIRSDGRLDLDDMKFLVELLSDAREVCPAFDELFFPSLKEIILQDGRVGQAEQFYLLKMLYSNGKIRTSEKEFLLQLRDELQEITPEFDALCETAFAADPTHWDVG